MNQLIYLAQQTPAGPPALLNMLPMVLMIVVFYFLLIRPQQKKAKLHDAFIGSLEKNMEVITSSGMHGTIIQVKDTTVTLRICENVKVEFDKTAVSRKK